MTKNPIAEIITIGTEITSGSTLNTNSYYLAQKLLELGIDCFYHTSVDDDEDRLNEVVLAALKRSDIIITTGGLGPTKDDLTKEIVSKAINQKLVLDSSMVEEIRQYFTKNNRPMSENNIKQGTRPENSFFLKNKAGTAPGIFINQNSKKIILLPGPPKELALMFENEVAPLLKSDSIIISKSINTVGIGESVLEMELNNMDFNDKNVSIATFAKNGYVEIKLIGKGFNKDEINNSLNDYVDKINNKFKDYIYGYGSSSLEEVVINHLREKRFKLALAESCTGGLVAHKLTSVAGASEVFERGVVSYSNQSKIDELNVKAETLDKYGAVSKETAYEMAKGLMDKEDLDLVVSITGLAGPGGGRVDKPIGLVYFCIMTRDHSKTIKANFTGDRKTIQHRAAIKALTEIWKVLL